MQYVHTNNDCEHAQIFCSIGLTASLLFHDVLTCFSEAITSQNARNKGRHPSILCSWELNTKYGVVLATKLEEAWAASKNVDTENSGLADGC